MALDFAGRSPWPGGPRGSARRAALPRIVCRAPGIRAGWKQHLVERPIPAEIGVERSRTRRALRQGRVRFRLGIVHGPAPRFALLPPVLDPARTRRKRTAPLASPLLASRCGAATVGFRRGRSRANCSNSLTDPLEIQATSLLAFLPGPEALIDQLRTATSTLPTLRSRTSWAANPGASSAGSGASSRRASHSTSTLEAPAS